MSLPITRLKTGAWHASRPLHQKKISCLFSILWCPSSFGRLLLCLFPSLCLKTGAWQCLYPLHQKKISCLFSILWCPSAFGRLLLCLSHHPLKNLRFGIGLLPERLLHCLPICNQLKAISGPTFV